MDRLSWQDTWLHIAATMRKRSKCVGRQVGAVIVDTSNRPVAMGYNGPPAGLSTGPSCDLFCERAITGERVASYDNCVSIHAEANALLFTDRSNYGGGTIYISDPPCWECTKLISNSGLKRVVYLAADAPWRNLEKSKQLLLDCGMEVWECPRSTDS